MPLWSETPHELSVARACSSMRIASWANVPPPPPYSSGTERQSRPTSPALFHRSRSTCLLARYLSTFGLISFSQNVRARSRKSSRSPRDPAGPIQGDRRGGIVPPVATKAGGHRAPSGTTCTRYKVYHWRTDRNKRTSGDVMPLTGGTTMAEETPGTPRTRTTRRDQLVAAALSCIEEFGPGVGMGQIAERAGVPRPHVYRVIASKDELDA